MLAKLQSAFAPRYPRGYVGRHRAHARLRSLARRIFGSADVPATGVAR
jgi:hypothetical protein